MKRCKTARGRAARAARMLKAGQSRPPWQSTSPTDCRDFDTCFEEFDGDAVVAILRQKAASDPVLLAACRAHGLLVEGCR